MWLWNEHLTMGLAVALASAAVLYVCGALIWRRIKTNLAWERGLARPLVVEGIRTAIQMHKTRTGKWPAAKSDLRGRVRVDERVLQSVGTWDIRLVSSGRGGDTARYSIMVKDSWEKWDAGTAPDRPDKSEGVELRE